MSSVNGSMAAVLETSARLLRLLSLLSARRTWGGPELAGRLGVTARTVRRDVDKLRTLGYPVDAAPGLDGGYRLRAGSALPPLLLDDEQAVAVAVGLRTATGTGVAGVAEAAARALATLEQVMPARLRPTVDALARTTVAMTGAEATVDARVLAVLASACRDGERVRFAYRDRTGAPSRRHVTPHRLVDAGRWYLVAHDVDRDAWRSFRLDRIAAPQPTGRRATAPDPPDAAAFVSEGMSTAPYAHRAVVRVHAPADVVRARVPPTAGQVEPDGAHACVLTTGSDSLAVIAVHLAWLGEAFTVVEPDALREEVRGLADRLAAAADSG